MLYKNRCYRLISNEVYLFSQTLSYILILPKLFYLQTSVKSQRSYIGRQPLVADLDELPFFFFF